MELREVHGNTASRTRVLVVGGSPEPSSPALVAALAARADHVVAVDRGLDALLAADLGCEVFCGDADSVSARGAALVRAAEAGAQADGAARAFEVERYDPHKDFTDLSLALRAVRERWGGVELTCTCLSGGAPDHALAALGCLASFPAPVTLVEDGFTCRILHAGDSWALGARLGARFSFIPLDAGVTVSEKGMRWELDRATPPLLSDLGISNVIECDSARITCHAGTLAAWCFQPLSPSGRALRETPGGGQGPTG